MSEFLKHLGLFVSMISFFSGVIVLTLNQLLCKKEKKELFYVLRKFHWIFFFYTLIVFSYYYEEVFVVGKDVRPIINFAGNIMLAVLFAAYAKVILFLNECKSQKGYFFLKISCAGYICVWFWVAFFVRNYSAQGVTDAAARIAAGAMEAVLLCVVLFFAWEQMKDRKEDSRLWFFMTAFLLQALWEIVYDLAIVVPPLYFTHRLKPFNISIMIYLAVNVMLLLFVYQKEIFGEKLTENTFEKAAKQYNLTSREKELLRLVLEGKNNQEIAEQLFISTNTVKHHISSIYKKTETGGRPQLLKKFGKNMEL